MNITHPGQQLILYRNLFIELFLDTFHYLCNVLESLLFYVFIHVICNV